MIKISAGKFKNRTLETPNDKVTIPTMGKTKEAIFNALSTRVKDAEVLDLFAGSGSLGIEALSRGAACITFVDNSLFSIAAINNNIKKLGIENETKVIKKEAIRYLDEEPNKFDLIIMDPPYHEGKLCDKAIDLILKNELLKEDGIIVVESKGQIDEAKFIGFEKVKTYRHGIANVLIAWKKI